MFIRGSKFDSYANSKKKKIEFFWKHSSFSLNERYVCALSISIELHRVKNKYSDIFKTILKTIIPLHIKFKYNFKIWSKLIRLKLVVYMRSVYYNEIWVVWEKMIQKIRGQKWIWVEFLKISAIIALIRLEITK